MSLKLVRPTHFIAFDVSRSDPVVQAIRKVQDALVKFNPALKATLVDPAGAHLTAGVLTLSADQNVRRAQTHLQQLRPVLEQHGMLEPLTIRFKGINHFHSKVLFLELDASDASSARATRLAEVARNHFRSAQLLAEASRPLQLHLTIAKCSRARRGGRAAATDSSRLGGGGGSSSSYPQPQHQGRELQPDPSMMRGHLSFDAGTPSSTGIECIPPDAYAACQREDAVSVELDCVQLCSMFGRRQHKYYDVCGQLDLVPPPV